MAAPQSPQQQQQLATAKKLVNLSHILGWGGIGTLFLIAPLLGAATHSAVVGIGVAAVGGLSAVAGAIVGQIGRGMQGRVI
jgi:hypothetical protein